MCVCVGGGGGGAKQGDILVALLYVIFIKSQ